MYMSLVEHLNLYINHKQHLCKIYDNLNGIYSRLLIDKKNIINSLELTQKILFSQPYFCAIIPL